MNYDSLMIHYGELSTKGLNKKAFINTLYLNTCHAVKKLDVKVSYTRDFILIKLNDTPYEDVLALVQEVPGIQRISLVAKVEKDIELIAKAAVELLAAEEGKKFKVDVHRVDKAFPMRSYDATCYIADAILKNTDKKVDLHDYDILLKVAIRNDFAYLSCHDYPGLGGYPLGMNGKVMHLLSGGLDSPVAAYSLLRRGIGIECIHFASPPYTSAAVIDKLEDILKELNTYQRNIKLNIIPFTKIQEAIYANVPEPYCITIMRRMMMRLAVGLAKKHHCLAISTGESIGQVASQTLHSIQVINEVTNFPVLRPLSTEDKVSIIETSKKINTYEISIRPYEDCCTIFKPKKPKTMPSLNESKEYESRFDFETMIEEALANVETLYIEEGYVHE